MWGIFGCKANAGREGGKAEEGKVQTEARLEAEVVAKFAVAQADGEHHSR